MYMMGRSGLFVLTTAYFALGRADGTVFRPFLELSDKVCSRGKATQNPTQHSSWPVADRVVSVQGLFNPFPTVDFFRSPSVLLLKYQC